MRYAHAKRAHAYLKRLSDEVTESQACLAHGSVRVGSVSATIARAHI